jgi:hypothetical protein
MGFVMSDIILIQAVRLEMITLSLALVVTLALRQRDQNVLLLDLLQIVPVREVDMRDDRM